MPNRDNASMPLTLHDVGVITKLLLCNVIFAAFKESMTLN